MKILVTAASKHGATAEIAESIGSKLRKHGHEVEIIDPDEVVDVASFEAVVIGSAVYAGHWLKPATDLVNRFSTWPDRRVWLFSSGPIGDPPKPEEDPVDVAAIMTATGARGHRVFAGRLDKGKLGFAERAIITAFRASYGDFRDWEEVTAWATDIARELQGVPSEKR